MKPALLFKERAKTSQHALVIKQNSRYIHIPRLIYFLFEKKMSEELKAQL